LGERGPPYRGAPGPGLEGLCLKTALLPFTYMYSRCFMKPNILSTIIISISIFIWYSWLPSTRVHCILSCIELFAHVFEYRFVFWCLSK